MPYQTANSRKAPITVVARCDGERSRTLLREPLLPDGTLPGGVSDEVSNVERWTHGTATSRSRVSTPRPDAFQAASPPSKTRTFLKPRSVSSVAANLLTGH